MWPTPEELVSVGLGTAPVVVANEGHNGLARCVRTRVVGARMVEAVHDLGCRALAMEALPNRGHGPTEHTLRPVDLAGAYEAHYLRQPEMIDLIDTAVARGWTLIGYEADFGLAPAEVRADTMSQQATNWRESQQAGNLAEAISRLDPELLLVWVGNGHHNKSSLGWWTPMGYLLRAWHGVNAFCIDQLDTVSLGPGHEPRVKLTTELASLLDGFGGTAGFTAVDPPPGHSVVPGYDASLLSTGNGIVGEQPDPPLPNPDAPPQ